MIGSIGTSPRRVNDMVRSYRSNARIHRTASPTRAGFQEVAYRRRVPVVADRAQLLADLAQTLDIDATLRLIDEHIANERWEQSLALVELLLGAGDPQGGIQRRHRATLLGLRQRAESNHRNDYELYWLDAQLNALEPVVAQKP
jgi:hypothetical protein